MESDSYKRNNKNNNSQDELDNEQKVTSRLEIIFELRQKTHIYINFVFLAC